MILDPLDLELTEDDDRASGVYPLSREEEVEEFPAFPWDRERLYRLRVWRQYERETRAGQSEAATYGYDHLVDEQAVDEFTNEVLAELRAGKSLREALDIAYAEDEPC